MQTRMKTRGGKSPLPMGNKWVLNASNEVGGLGLGLRVAFGLGFRGIRVMFGLGLVHHCR